MYGFAVRTTAPPRGAGGARATAAKPPAAPTSPSGTRTASAMRATPALTSRTRTASCAASPGVHDPPLGSGRVLARDAGHLDADRGVVGAVAHRVELALVALQLAAVVGDARAQAADLLGGRRLGQRPQQPAALGARLGQARGGAVVGVGDVVGALLQRLDVAELAQPGQRVVEAAGRHAQDERRGRAPVAGGDLRGLHEAPGRLRGPHDAVAGRLHVGGGQLEARAALDAPLAGGCGRRTGGGREPRRAGAAGAPACAAAALRGVRGLLLGGRRRGASPPPLLLALSFEPPPALSTTATRAARTQPATPSAGTSGRSRERGAPARRLGEAARDALVQARPEAGRHRRRLGAHVAHERGELGLGGGIAGEGGLERFELGGHGGVEGGLMTAHGRPPEVGRGRGARECPRWRARRRGRRRSRRCSVRRGTSGR